MALREHKKLITRKLAVDNICRLRQNNIIFVGLFFRKEVVLYDPDKGAGGSAQRGKRRSNGQNHETLVMFGDTFGAERLKKCGVVLSYICPLMYMNNPLCKAKPVITSSNKLRTYTSARYYTDREILDIITSREGTI